MKEHPRYSEILPFSCVRAYTLRRDSKGAMPLGTQTLEQSLVCYTLPEVYTLSRYARTQRLPPVSHIGGRPSSHKANLIPQNKRQDTIAMMIPCLCSFRFSSCTVHHKTAVIPVDIPTRWEPRAKQQPTGLIAYSADWRRQSRPVRVLYRHQTKNPQTKV